MKTFNQVVISMVTRIRLGTKTWHIWLMTRKWSLVIFFLIINVKFWHSVNNGPKYLFFIFHHSPPITMLMKSPTNNRQHHHMMIMLPFFRANVENWLSLKKPVLPWCYKLLPLSLILPSLQITTSSSLFIPHNTLSFITQKEGKNGQ
jgi:hypothetical protein